MGHRFRDDFYPQTVVTSHHGGLSPRWLTTADSTVGHRSPPPRWAVAGVTVTAGRGRLPWVGVVGLRWKVVEQQVSRGQAARCTASVSRARLHYRTATLLHYCTTVCEHNGNATCREAGPTVLTNSSSTHTCPAPGVPGTQRQPRTPSHAVHGEITSISLAQSRGRGACVRTRRRLSAVVEDRQRNQR